MSGASIVPNTTIGTNTTITTTGTAILGHNKLHVGRDDSPTDGLENMVLDLDKILSMPKEKRKMIMDLFEKFSKSSTSYDNRFLIRRTLDVYGVFVDATSLDRKLKINGVIED